MRVCEGMGRAIRRTRRRPIVLNLLCVVLLGCNEVGQEVGQEDDENVEPRTCLDDDAQVTQVPDLPLVYQTENIDIYVQEGHFMCAGTANDYQRFVSFVADELGMQIQRRIPFYMVLNPSNWCSANGGCVRADGVTFAYPNTSYHELAHAVACEARHGAPSVLQEGLAVAYEPLPNTVRGDPTLFTEVHQDAFGQYYSVAGHFVRWLHEELGPGAFRDLYRTATYKSGVWSAIEAAYGTTAQTDYLANGPALWVPHRQCADLSVLEPEGDTWVYDARIDCQDPATFGPYERWHSSSTSYGTNEMYHSFLIDIETPGTYRLDRLDFDTTVNLERCLDEHPATEDDIDTEWVRDGVWFNFQNVGAAEIEHPGLWRVDVLRPPGPPVDVWVTIAPEPG